MSDYEGILVVDKPAGWTSHDVVQKTKNLLGGCKVGHTGTLDPFATGVLILLIGKATKKAKYFEQDSKGYDAEVTFGFATDSYDITGTVTSTGDPGSIDRQKLIESLESFKGEIYQTPPMYSALKVNGKRLYKLARQGKTVEIEKRKVCIDSLEAEFDNFPSIRILLECSKGTYVRSLAKDLGDAVGCPAHLSKLRRTRAGNYDISEALDFQVIVDTEDRSTLLQHLQPVSMNISEI